MGTKRETGDQFRRITIAAHRLWSEAIGLGVSLEALRREDNDLSGPMPMIIRASAISAGKELREAVRGVVRASERMLVHLVALGLLTEEDAAKLTYGQAIAQDEHVFTAPPVQDERAQAIETIGAGEEG